MRASEFVTEGAVEDLEKDLKQPYSYDAIDHMMQTIAREQNITPKQLHDRFVEKHGQTPDEWIKEKQVNENFADIGENVIGATDLIDVYIRGKHGKELFTKLVAKNFPNNRLDALVTKLVDKYNINPNAVVYGPSRSIDENFADGKKPGRKGLAKRMGVPTRASVTRLRQIAKSSSGEKARMAHWMANMKSGRKK